MNLYKGGARLKIGTGKNWKAESYLEVPWESIVSTPGDLPAYEIGDWGPMITNPNISLSYSKYFRFADMVHVTISLTVNSMLAGSDPFLIDGLPFVTAPTYQTLGVPGILSVAHINVLGVSTICMESYIQIAGCVDVQSDYRLLTYDDLGVGWVPGTSLCISGTYLIIT